MLYAALNQGSVFLALLYFGLAAGLLTEPFNLLCNLIKTKQQKPKKQKAGTVNKNIKPLTASVKNETKKSKYSKEKNKDDKSFFTPKTQLILADILLVIVAAFCFAAGLLLFNYGELRFFCLLAFLTGLVLERFFLSKTIAIVILKGYNFLAKLFKQLGGRLCKGRRKKEHSVKTL